MHDEKTQRGSLSGGTDLDCSLDKAIAEKKIVDPRKGRQCISRAMGRVIVIEVFLDIHGSIIITLAKGELQLIDSGSEIWSFGVRHLG